MAGFSVKAFLIPAAIGYNLRFVITLHNLFNGQKLVTIHFCSLPFRNSDISDCKDNISDISEYVKRFSTLFSDFSEIIFVFINLHFFILFPGWFSDPSGLVFAGGAGGLVYRWWAVPIHFPVFRVAGGLVGLVPILPGWWAGGGYTEKPHPGEGVP